MDSFLIIIICLSLIPLVLLGYMSKDTPFFLPNNSTDNEKMLRAAKIINIFHWPSKMHQIKYNRSQYREYWTIMCLTLMKIFKNQKNDFVTIMLGLLANFFSTILIYFIFSNYFDQTIGLVASLIYLTSFWSYHICLFIGHVVLSQMFFLLSILFLQLTNDQTIFLQLFLFALAGSFSVISFASSSASWKYPPLALIAFLFSIKNDFSISPSILDTDLFLISIPLLFSAAVLYSLKNIEKKSFLKKLSIILLAFIILSLVLLSILKITYFGQLKIASFFFGFTIIFLHLTLPIKDFANNLKRYLIWRASIQFSHFLSYPDKFQLELFKKKLPTDFRGGGIYWNFKVFNVFMPFLFPIYLISVLSFCFISIFDLFNFKNYVLFTNFIIFLIISLVPILIHDFTKGIKVGKAYFATFLTFLIFPFIFLSNLQYSSFASILDNKSTVIYVFYLICFLQAIHTIFIINETLNSRLFVKNLYNFLLKNKITEFSTYDNKYNECFVKNMLESFPNNFKINFIKNLNELKNNKNKLLIVPPITSKVFNFNTDYKAAAEGYFKGDPNLVDLINTKKIENYAIKKFQTMSSYKFYIYDDEVLSYRSIYLNQIKDEDRYKGLGWVLDLKDFKYSI